MTGDCICPSGNEGVKCDQSVVTVKPTNEASEGGGAGIGSIIPIVVGAAGAVGLILLIVAAVFLWRFVFTGDTTRFLKRAIARIDVTQPPLSVSVCLSLSRALPLSMSMSVTVS